MKKSFKVIKYVFENGPNFLFWLLLLIGVFSWLNSLPVLLRIAIGIMAAASILVVLKKMAKNIATIVAEAGALNAVEAINNNRTDILKKFINNVPSEKQLGNIYKYGTKFASNFADDGELVDVKFYINCEKTKMSKTAQLFIFSKNRGETLTVYIPGKSSNTEEGSPIHITGQKNKAINAYPHWREAVILSIENNAKDFGKADVVRLQISPYDSSLRLSFYYVKNNHHWKCSYILDSSKLFKNEEEIADFSMQTAP